jgi:hypothetical protein
MKEIKLIGKVVAILLIGALLATACATETQDGTDNGGATMLGGVEWFQTFGGSDYEWGESVQQISDGGYIIIGKTWSYGA